VARLSSLLDIVETSFDTFDTALDTLLTFLLEFQSSTAMSRPLGLWHEPCICQWRKAHVQNLHH
jgi:hypothetical protein